jgi:hypothetical protein
MGRARDVLLPPLSPEHEPDPNEPVMEKANSETGGHYYIHQTDDKDVHDPFTGEPTSNLPCTGDQKIDGSWPLNW